MIAVLLLLIPLVAGLGSFFIRQDRQARSWGLLASLLTLAVSLLGLTALKEPRYLSFHADWMGALNSSFSIKLDGMGQLLCLLNAIAFPVIFIATWRTHYRSAGKFIGLMLLTQVGMMGVFLAMDALLFYFFWELALIPAYFLCSQWGGPRRIPVTFKFFVYTFIGSLLMLIGLLYIYFHTPTRSFDISAFYSVVLTYDQQSWLFWLLFLAFAIKMPIFPFHTWQPDTYEQSPTATTMVLSGVMVKMGVFGLIRWLMPIVPMATNNWAMLVSTLCVIGILYASLIAIRQDDLKRLVAYSSIAHIGLICLAVFANNKIGLQGVMIQMFNHGINIIALWIIVEVTERQFGTRKISELGGIALKAPALAIFTVVIAMANIALPLTNAFVGEFMMFNGVFQARVYDGSYTLFGTIPMTAKHFSVMYTVLAGIGIILAAVYTLNMVRKVFYGPANELTGRATDIKWNEKLVLVSLVVLIFAIGVYSGPMLDVTNETTDAILNKSDILGKTIKK